MRTVRSAVIHGKANDRTFHFGVVPRRRAIVSHDADYVQSLRNPIEDAMLHHSRRGSV